MTRTTRTTRVARIATVTRSREVGTLAGLLVLCVALWAATPYFATVSNLVNVVEQSAIIGVLAIGMTFVILTGGIDLSVGSIVALAGIVMGLGVRAGVPVALGVVGCLSVGALCGLVNGALVTIGRLPPFIATLGMMSVARGAALVLADGRPISPFPASFRTLATGHVAGLPVPVLLMLALYAVAPFVLVRTTPGRYTYAIGGNEEATALSGVNVRGYKAAVYGVSGLLSAVTSLLLIARLNSAQPIAGIGYELDAIAAVVIGGASPGGRRGLGARHAHRRAHHERAAQRVELARRLVVRAADRDRHGDRRGGPRRHGAAPTGAPSYGAVKMTRTWLGLAAVAFVAACNRGGAGEGAAGARPTVALVPKTMNNPFFIDMERGARAAADSLGLELVVQAPEREIDVEAQMRIVENLIQRRVAAIALVPSGSREIVPAIVKANQAGIPVAIVDTRVDTAALRQAGGRVATFIGSDNADGGRIAGRFIAEQLGGRGTVAVIEGIPGHESGDARLRGFRDALGAHPDVRVVSSQPANWERDLGFTVMQNTLQSHPDVQAVFACNDVMALGAVEAIAAAGKTGRIVVVGFDAQDDARAAIQAGRMTATIAQSPAQMGRAAMHSVYRLLHDETVRAEQPVTIELVTKAQPVAP